MKRVILNGALLKTKRELHEQFAKQLFFPKYYGYNLDALYDCLSEDPAVDILILDYPCLCENLGEAAADGLMAVLLDICKNHAECSLRIAASARKHEGVSDASEEEAELFE